MGTDKLLNIAKQIIDANNGYVVLTGTLMLHVRGLLHKIGRDPHDIDLLIIQDYAPHINLPEHLKLKQKGIGSDGCSAKYETDDGVIIDVLSTGIDEREDINGILCGSLELLMNAKYDYSLQNNPQAEKHKQDLIALGFDFEKKQKEIEKSQKIDLPF